MPSISNFIGRFIGFISMVLMGIGFFMLIKTIKKTNRVRASSLLLSMVFSLAMLLFNVLVMRSAQIQWWFPLILMFGAGFGFAWGTTTSLNIHEEKILGKRSVLYIYFWLASMLLTQVLAFFAKSNAVAFGLAGMFFSTGASLGTNGNILYRMRRLLRSPMSTATPEGPPPSQAVAGRFCVKCGAALKENAKFCSRCGWKTETTSVKTKGKGWIIDVAIAGIAVLVFGGIFLVWLITNNKISFSIQQLDGIEDIPSGQAEPAIAQPLDTVDANPVQDADTPQTAEPTSNEEAMITPEAVVAQSGDFISVSFDSMTGGKVSPVFSEEYMKYFNAEGLGVIESTGFGGLMPIMVPEKKMGDFSSFFDFMMPDAFEDSACGFIFRSKGNIADGLQEFYALFLYPQKNELKMGVWIDDGWIYSQVLEPDPPFNLDYEINSVQLEVSGESMKIYVNDSFVGNFNEGTLTEPGLIGLFLFPSGSIPQGEIDYVLFDNLMVIEK